MNSERERESEREGWERRFVSACQCVCKSVRMRELKKGDIQHNETNFDFKSQEKPFANVMHRKIM